MFMGYVNLEEETKQKLNYGGLLHTGDVGLKDEKGFLYLTGRLKGISTVANVL